MSDSEHLILQTKIRAHIGWLKSYVGEALVNKGLIRDALLYSERQLNRLDEDFDAYQKLMNERVHYAEGTADLAMKQRDIAESSK